MMNKNNVSVIGFDRCWIDLYELMVSEYLVETAHGLLKDFADFEPCSKEFYFDVDIDRTKTKEDDPIALEFYAVSDNESSQIFYGGYYARMCSVE